MRRLRRLRWPLLFVLLLLWTSTTHAAVRFLEPGSSATYDLSLWDLTSGTVTSDASVTHNQPRSIKIAGNLGATQEYVFRYLDPTPLLAAGGRVCVYIKMTHHDDGGISLRTSGGDNLVWTQTDGGTGFDNGKLRIIIAGQSFDSTLTLPSGANLTDWWQQCVAYTITNTTTNEWRVWVNGTLYITASNVNLTGYQETPTRLMLHGDNSGASNPVWFSDIYTDDDTSLTWPGDIRVTAKLPAANNTNNFDTAIGNNPANRWENVNERALSLTNGWRHNAISSAQENFTLQAAGVGDTDLSSGATLVAHLIWIWAKGTAGGAGTPKIMANGTETAIVLTATPTYYYVTTTSASYPSNAAGCGLTATNNADDSFLYECGAIIAYTLTGGVGSTISGGVTIGGGVMIR